MCHRRVCFHLPFALTLTGQGMTIGGSLNLSWMTREGHRGAGHVCKMDRHL